MVKIVTPQGRLTQIPKHVSQLHFEFAVESVGKLDQALSLKHSLKHYQALSLKHSSKRYFIIKALSTCLEIIVVTEMILKTNRFVCFFVFFNLFCVSRTLWFWLFHVSLFSCLQSACKTACWHSTSTASRAEVSGTEK